MSVSSFASWATAGMKELSYYVFYRMYLHMRKALDDQRIHGQWAIEEICAQRRNAFRAQLKEKFSRQIRVAEVNASAAPLHPGRPYGLPPDLSEAGQMDVWGYILEYVDQPEDIISLREVSTIFQCILERKYKAAKLAEVYNICLQNTPGNRCPDGRFTNDLLPLRLICKTTRILTDELLMKDRLHKIDYEYNKYSIGLHPYFFQFPLDYPHFGEEVFTRVRLWAEIVEGIRRQGRLPQFVNTLEQTQAQDAPLVRTLPVKDMYLSEIGIQNLPELRHLFTRLFGIVGGSILSFLYNTEQSGHGTYETLRGWITLLPNLVELRVSRRGQGNGNNEVPPNQVEAFPVSPKLRSLREINHGFPLPFLVEILKATPALRHVDLCHFPENRLDALLELDAGVPLEVLNCGQTIPISFLVRGTMFQWPLKTLIFEGTGNLRYAVPCRAMIDFVNSFGATLEVLVIDMWMDNSGGILQLPKLRRLTWRLHPNQEDLKFMHPLQSLEILKLDTMFKTSWINTKKEDVLKHLKENNVPKLFPKMKSIMAVVGNLIEDFRFEEVWKRGDAV